MYVQCTYVDTCMLMPTKVAHNPLNFNFHINYNKKKNINT